ncbi:MAG: hypothetical protein RLZZ502_227 [Pseudomonadota bacterium]|jgi:hypothetical protein
MLRKQILALLSTLLLATAHAQPVFDQSDSTQAKISPPALTLLGQTVAACFEDVPIEVVLLVQVITGGYTAYPAGTRCESLGASLFVGILTEAVGVNIYAAESSLQSTLCSLTKILCQSGPYKPPKNATVVEYHHARLNHYFMSADAVEQAYLDNGGAGGGWVRTGETFSALAAGTGVGNDVCRFYSAPFNTHFYTADRAECAAVKTEKNYWAYEGLAFRVGMPILNICPSNGKEVFRLHNNRFAQKDGNHRYTTRASTATLMVLLGWKLEGTVFCTVQ